MTAPAVQLSANARQRFFDNNGNPLAGGKLFTYVSGTSTKQATYTDSTGATPNTNPIILDAQGECDVWRVIGETYRDVLAPANDTDPPTNSFWTRDGITASSITLTSAISGILYGNGITIGGVTVSAPLAFSAGTLSFDPTNIAFTQLGTGAVASTMDKQLKRVFFPEQFGAVRDNTHDDTSAIQACITAANANSGMVQMLAGTYKVTDAITVPDGLIVEGMGRTKTIISVPNTFNLSANGVFVSSGEEGPVFRSFKVTFAQPDTNTRASLVSYPPAFYLRNCPRFTMEDIKITQSMIGIDMKGNSGGAFIDLLEIQSYVVAIDIDGSLDSVRINRNHHWNFDLTANQQSIYFDGTAIGIKVGQMDDLHVTDGLFLHKGPSIYCFTSGGHTPFGHITSCMFDTFGWPEVLAGNFTVTGCKFSLADGSDRAIYQVAGELEVTGCQFNGNPGTGYPFVELNGSGDLHIDSCTFEVNDDRIAVKGSTGTVIVKGCKFNYPPNTSPSQPVILSASGRLTAIGNRMTDKGTGAGTMIYITSDDWHVIIGNTGVGWTAVTHPAVTLAVYANNS